MLHSSLNKTFFTLAIAFAASLLATTTRAQDLSRQIVSIDADWRFTKDDPADAGDKLKYPNIKNWMLATGENLVRDADAPRHARPEGNIGQDVAYTTPAFDDSQWRQLNLPHDWGIEGPFDPQGNGNTGKLPYYGVGWYRKHLEIPASDAGKKIYLDMDGAMAYANIWLNGQYAGGWGYGYASFRIDLTPYVKPGGENVLAIRLDNPNNSSRWYPGGGIYRNVWLVKTSPVHVSEWGTYLTTPQIGADSATADLRVSVDNDGKTDTSAILKSQIFELDRNNQRQGSAVISTTPMTVEIAAGKTMTAGTTALVSRPKLWSLESPNRYVAVTTVEQNGKVVDTYETPFGIRTIKFDANEGFSVNGVHAKLNGVCDHSDLGALGTAVNYRALERQIEMLKEMGCNAIRTSHNPPAPELLELCDKMGIVVMDETFDCWLQSKNGSAQNGYNLLFADWSERDARTLIRRDRNHPCVVLWSIGNEIPEQTRPNGAEMAARLSRIVHEEDPTRPTTSACNNAQPGSPFLAAIDAIGLNYQGSRPSAQHPLGNYEPAHQSQPGKFIYGSETASTISTRGVYTFPVAQFPGAVAGAGGGRGRRGGATQPNNDPPSVPVGEDVLNHQMSSYDLYYPSWATSPDTEFAVQDHFPYVSGEFVWTGFDYLGEPTPFNSSRSSYFGIIDLAGFPKDRYYIYQAHWRPDFPMAHILPHWNWPDRVGQVTPVHVYTSGDEAELFLNGKSLGKQKKEQYTYRIRWDDVKYEPGELKVVTWKNGKPWADAVMKTTGAPTKLTLKPDRAKIMADGQDLSFVTVTVADKDGLMVPMSMNMLKFDISGPGEIAAVDNGDPTSLESFHTTQMKAFNGLCLVIVRSKPGQPGAITLKASSEGLIATETTINTAK